MECRRNFETLRAVYLRRHITNSFIESVLKIAILSCGLHFFCNFFILLWIHFYFTWLTDKYTDKKIGFSFKLTYSSSLCWFHVARVQTKFCRSCQQHIVGWTGLHLLLRELYLINSLEPYTSLHYKDLVRTAQ